MKLYANEIYAYIPVLLVMYIVYILGFYMLIMAAANLSNLYIYV